jgi:hypothetical protein
MKTIITSTRIPANQANGSYNILLPSGFGQPRGFLVYAMPYSVQPNNFDSTTTFPCISVGFGGSNIAGTGLTNACAWVSNEDGARPTSTLASFGNTVAAFSRNIANTVFRQWQMTNFGQDIIFGTYASSGTQAEPMDLVFTVFGGNDFFCAVGQTAIVAAINTRTDVGLTFRPEAILFSHARPAQTTDGQMSFGVSLKSLDFAGLAVTTPQQTLASHWRNTNGLNTSETNGRLQLITPGSYNLATNAQVRFNSMYNSGFAITQSTANSGNSIIFLAMKSGSGNTDPPPFRTVVPLAGLAGSIFRIQSNAVFKPCQTIGTCAYYAGNFTGNTTTTAGGADMFSFYTGNGDSKSNTVGIGTFTSSTSSTTITGVGTSFLQQLGAIDTIYNQNYQLVGIVSSITSNTSLLLQSNAAITATGSSFIFEKPKQFSMSYGLRDADPDGNASMRAYFSDNAFIRFTAQTPTLTTQGRLLDYNFTGDLGLGSYLSFSLNTQDSAGFINQMGWALQIRDEDFYRIRRGSIS